MDSKQYVVKQTEEYVSYVLIEDIFSNLEYKVLLNQENGDFLPLYLMRQNGRTQFLYSIPPMYQPLALTAADMEPQVMFSVIDALDRISTETEKNGFLKLEHLDMNLSRIFIESNSGKLQLIYLPVSEIRGTRLLNKDSIMRELIKELVSKNINLKVSGRVQRLNNDLHNGMIGYTQIVENIRGGIYDTKSQGAYFDDPGTVVMPSTIKRRPYFIIVENQRQIQVTKDIYILGKNVEMVDGVIYNHSEVSRRHCAVLTEGEKYFLEDLGSTNGSYVNQQRVQPRVRRELHNGDRLCLGNCEMIFYEG